MKLEHSLAISRDFSDVDHSQSVVTYVGLNLSRSDQISKNDCKLLGCKYITLVNIHVNPYISRDSEPLCRIFSEILSSGVCSPAPSQQ